MIKKRDTVGKISTELLARSSDTHSAEEQMREQLSDYEKHINQCVETHKKTFDGDFYIIVITKKEVLMRNVIRHYFFGRLSCPTPDYDQTVYKYYRPKEELSFLWTIPSKMTCLYMKEHASEIQPEEFGLLKFVLEFADGTLFKRSKELNGEKIDTSELT
jgi:hypothetical protein